MLKFEKKSSRLILFKNFNFVTDPFIKFRTKIPVPFYRT